MDATEKCCVECGGLRPNDAVNFPLFRKQVSMCLACVVKKRKAKAAEREEYRARKMAKIEGKAVDAFVAAARPGGATIPHSAELLEQLITYFGGTAGFSSVMLKQYFDAKAGSAARTKMLETMVRLVTVNAEQGGSKKPMVMWTEEELQAELDQRVLEAAHQIAPRIVDARLVEEAPARIEVEASIGGDDATTA